MATMNDCKKVQPQLAEYVDGELAENAAWEVRKHLTTCAVCQTIADDFAATARLVTLLPEPKGPSANFEAMLARRIADECIAPKPLSLMDKLRGQWEERFAGTVAVPRFAPALAAAFAVSLALFPAGYMLTHKTGGTDHPPVPIKTTTANLVASDPTLTELWDEHASFSSAQPLGDPAAALTSATGNEE